MIGFDDLEVAPYIGLTTVAQPLYEGGRRGVERLLEMIDGRDTGPLEERRAAPRGAAHHNAAGLSAQNVHVMRDEVRAEYNTLERIDGDELFHARFARFFTELRDPALVALYGDDPRFPAQWGALLDTRSRAARPRRLTCGGSTTSEIARQLAAARAGGRLRHLRRPLRRTAGDARAARVSARARRLPA